MNAMTVSFVLVRLAAVFLFVRGVQGLSSFSYLLTGEAEIATFAVVTLVFGVFLPAGIAVHLWLHPEKVTGAQVAGSRGTEPLTAGQILTVGITLLGLYAFIYGLVDLFSAEADYALQRYMAATANLPDEVMRKQVLVSRVTYGVQIAVGVCLIMGRDGLSRLFLKAKYGGVAVPESDAVQPGRPGDA